MTIHDDVALGMSLPHRSPDPIPESVVSRRQRVVPTSSDLTSEERSLALSRRIARDPQNPASSG